MSSVMKVDVERPGEWLNLALAVILFLSPWVLGFAGETGAAWTAWATAVAIAALAVAALVQFAQWEAWAGLVLGLWLAASPWIVGFSQTATALWTHIVIGLLIAALAAWEAWSARYGRSATT